jgi:hypothetical protein
MASSSSFDLVIAQRGRTVAAARSDPYRTVTARGTEDVDGSQPITVSVARTGDTTSQLCVRLGTVAVLIVAPGQAAARADFNGLDGEFGDAVFVCEESIDDDAGEDAVPRVEIAVPVRATDSLRRFQEAVIADLERIHTGIALDVLSRTMHRRALRRGAESVVPEAAVARIEEQTARLSNAIKRIGEQPSFSLVRDLRPQRWRPGTRIRLSLIGDVVRDPATRFEGGRFLALGRVLSESVRTSTDIAEHRHIRAGIVRLRSRCRGLQDWCARAEAQYQQESARWGGDRGPGSIHAQEIAPRIEVLRRIARRAETVGQALGRLLQEHAFLQESGLVRTQLGPTPIFLGRRPYRDAFEALRQIASVATISGIGEDVRVRFKALSRLYEYWCFVRVVEMLGEMIGPPVLPGSFRVVDDFYRPDLDPGQTFRFTAPEGLVVFVTYEPTIRPEGWRPEARALPGEARGGAVRRPSDSWVSTLSSAPLRPDVLIEVVAPGRPTIALILDAKSTRAFNRDRLWEASDYRTRILDPSTGRQPVRHVFMVHPNPSIPPIESLPGYLAGARGAIDNSIIGAVGFSPEDTSPGHRVLSRFLGLAGIEANRTAVSG